MEDILKGEEVDTKHMIQAQKSFHFFLPHPTKQGETREKDEDFAEQLKEINTVRLLDHDSNYGTLYFGK